MGILASDSEDKSLHSPRQFLNASRTATPIGGRRFEDTTTIANLHLKSDAHVPPSLSPASEIRFSLQVIVGGGGGGSFVGGGGAAAAK